MVFMWNNISVNKLIINYTIKMDDRVWPVGTIINTIMTETFLFTD